MSRKRKKISLLLPSKLHFRKPSKSLAIPPFGHLDFANPILRNGTYGIQATESGLMSKHQIEAIRITLRRPLKILHKSKIWVLIKATQIFTKRSAQTRMGRGKGAGYTQYALIAKGQMLYEIEGPTKRFMYKIFKGAQKKFSISTRLINCSN